jgi:acetylornithine deacetylase/succinyl-diaminopimelate desuccinylase-like protein
MPFTLPVQPLRPLFALLLASTTGILPAACARAATPPLSREAMLLARYLQFDTSNPPGDEAAAIAWLAERAREAGASVEVSRSPGGRSNLIARLPATVPNAPVVVLMHHADVVPPGPGWSFAPFAGEVAEGALRGRGAIDAKSLGIAQLAALADAASLPARQRELLLLAVADEEAGGGEGAGFLVEKRPELFARVEAVLNEGGANRSVDGRKLSWGIEIEQKRPLWIEVRAHGRGGHASNADPAGPAHRLIAGLAALTATPPALRRSPAGEAFLSRAARIDPRAARAAAAAAKLGGATTLSAEDRAALVGYEALFTDTLQVTTLSGAERVNMVPREASARLDVRLLPESDADAHVAALRAQLGTGLEVEVLHAAPPVPASPIDGAVWRALTAELARLSPGVPVIPLLIPAATDSRYFRARGIAAYGFSPFTIDARELRTVHDVDERLSLADFDRGVATMKSVVRALVAAPGAP